LAQALHGTPKHWLEEQAVLQQCATGRCPHPTLDTRCASCERDSNGRIKRDPAANGGSSRGSTLPGSRATGKKTGACPGYVVDHIVPLKRGGSDTPANMQWQTKEEGYNQTLFRQ
jgi:hypothetical protein